MAEADFVVYQIPVWFGVLFFGAGILLVLAIVFCVVLYSRREKT